MSKFISQNRKVIVGGLAVAAASVANATDAVITTGNTGLDGQAVLMVAAIAGIAILAGTAGALKGGVTVFNKVVKYFSKAS